MSHDDIISGAQKKFCTGSKKWATKVDGLTPICGVVLYF
jgi:hypothetical protein